MTHFIGTTIPSNFLDFSPSTKTYSAEDSDLCHANITDRMYEDSADRGFRMSVDTPTGVREVDFVLIDTRHNADQELMYWEFAPSHADRCFNAYLNDVRAVIYND